VKHYNLATKSDSLINVAGQISVATH